MQILSHPMREREDDTWISKKYSCNNSDTASLHFIDKFSNEPNANLHIEINRLLQVKDLHTKPSELEDER